ncbi:MAG: pentapeptide repeat-containing protein, partial [Planctomycetes bacterium]|nr:pentapeptide repeat-containing protein [Planctomycetota bacterium]
MKKRYFTQVLFAMGNKELTESRKREEEIRACVRTWLHWLIWDFSGARYIWRKIRPENEELSEKEGYPKPCTFFLWAIGVYMVLYGLTSTKYELTLDHAESRMSTVVAQLSTNNDEANRNLIAQIPEIQKIKTLIKPEIFNPVSVVLSLFDEKANPDIINSSKKIFEGWKTKLNKVNLCYANLTGTFLWDATLTNAYLGEANLYHVRNLPERTRKQALAMGAVDMAPNEWKIFKLNGYNKGSFYNIKIVTDDFKKWFSKPMPFEIGTKEKFNQELVRTLENLAADKKRW